MMGNANFTVKVYSPSGELLNEHASNESLNEGASLASMSLGWLIKEPGTYHIVIMNLSPTEPLELKGAFQFTRNRFYRPFAKLGYATLALGFPLVLLVDIVYRRLRKAK